MKNMKNTNFRKGPRMAWSPYSLTLRNLIFSALILTGIQAPLQAQEAQYTKPTWWIGGAVGANFNFYRGTTQELNTDLTIPAAVAPEFIVIDVNANTFP